MRRASTELALAVSTVVGFAAYVIVLAEGTEAFAPENRRVSLLALAALLLLPYLLAPVRAVWRPLPAVIRPSPR